MAGAVRRNRADDRGVDGSSPPREESSGRCEQGKRVVSAHRAACEQAVSERVVSWMSAGLDRPAMGNASNSATTHRSAVEILFPRVRATSPTCSDQANQSRPINSFNRVHLRAHETPTLNTLNRARPGCQGVARLPASPAPGLHPLYVPSVPAD